MDALKLFQVATLRRHEEFFNYQEAEIPVDYGFGHYYACLPHAEVHDIPEHDSFDHTCHPSCRCGPSLRLKWEPDEDGNLVAIPVWKHFTMQ